MNPKPLPRPRPCIVVALEIIGLDDPSMPEGRRRQVVTQLEALAEPALDKTYDQYVSFANNRVLYVVPIKKPAALPFWVLLGLVHLLPELIARNVVVRGAVTIGDVAARGTSAFGPGVSNAQRLCDQVADVPRIIIDPKVFREVERNPEVQADQHSLMEDLGYLESIVRLDSDGLYFVDYLWANGKEMAENAEYFRFVKYHGQLAHRRLETAKTLDHEARSNLWLWRYHEQVLEQLRAEFKLNPDELADLRIPATSPLLYRFPPSAITPA